eukprot:4978119-Prymnesium_polylepis.1
MKEGTIRYEMIGDAWAVEIFQMLGCVDGIDRLYVLSRVHTLAYTCPTFATQESSLQPWPRRPFCGLLVASHAAL